MEELAAAAATAESAVRPGPEEQAAQAELRLALRQEEGLSQGDWLDITMYRAASLVPMPPVMLLAPVGQELLEHREEQEAPAALEQRQETEATVEPAARAHHQELQGIYILAVWWE